MNESKQNSIVLADKAILNKIYYIRDKKVMLDKDLAELYGVETRRLNEQILDAFQKILCFNLQQRNLKT